VKSIAQLYEFLAKMFKAKGGALWTFELFSSECACMPRCYWTYVLFFLQKMPACKAPTC